MSVVKKTQDHQDQYTIDKDVLVVSGNGAQMFSLCRPGTQLLSPARTIEYAGAALLT